MTVSNINRSIGSASSMTAQQTTVTRNIPLNIDSSTITISKEPERLGETLQLMKDYFEVEQYDSCITLGLLHLPYLDTCVHTVEVELSKRHQFEWIGAQLVSLIADSMRLSNQHSRALFYYDKAVERAFRVGKGSEEDWSTIRDAHLTKLLLNIGKCHYHLSSYKLALKNLNRVPVKHRSVAVLDLISKCQALVEGNAKYFESDSVFIGSNMEAASRHWEGQDLEAHIKQASISSHWLSIAKYYMRLSQYEKAIQILMKMIEECGTGFVLPVMNELALAFYLKGSFTESITIFKRIRREDPYSTRYMDIYATLVKSNGNISELGRLANELYERSPDLPETWVCFARLSETMSQHEKSLNYAEKALKISPIHSEAHLVKGLALCALDRWEEGYASLRASHSLFSTPYSFEALVSKTLKIERHSEAALYANSMASSLPSHPRTLLCLGMIHQSRGDYELARKAYEGALKIDPSCVNSITALSSILIADQKYDYAVEIMEKYAMYHQTEWFHTTLGDIFLAQQNYPAALQNYYTALGLNPEHQPAKDGIERVETQVRGDADELDDGSLMEDNAEEFEDPLD